MASSGGKTLGSTATLHSVAGDVIPREYHRKILKKIAQLTKVVHNLHTKVDEREDELKMLTEQHRAVLKRHEEQSASQLTKWEEERALVTILQTQLTSLETEREKLLNEQETFRNEFEDRFSSLRQKHIDQLREVSDSLSNAKSQLASRDNEYGNLEKRNSHLRTELKEMKERSAREMELLKESHSNALKENETAMKQVKISHEQIVRDLNQRREDELQSLMKSLTQKQDCLLRNEMSQYQEKLQKLHQDYGERESRLNQQISLLSSELTATKDMLALAEQKRRDLERELSQRETDSRANDSILRDKEREIDHLHDELKQLRERNDATLEKHRQQKEDIKSLTSRIGELEALRINHERNTCDVNNRIKSLLEKCEKLEQESKEKMISANQLTDSANERIRKLEKELEYLGQEKRELRAQFAREIESAHSQLSDKETQLEEEYQRALHQLKEKHQHELETLKRESEGRLASLQAQLDQQKSLEVTALSQRYDSSVADLCKTVSDKTEELRGLQNLHDALSKTLAEKEEVIKSLNNCIDLLKGKLTSSGNSLNSIGKERDSLKAEVTQLQLSASELTDQIAQIKLQHKERITATEARVKQEMEQYWMDKMSNELRLLRQDLDKQYSDMNEAALNKLIDLKDSSFKQSEEMWSKDKDKLLLKIGKLEQDIVNLQQSSKESLSLADSQAQSLLAELKQQLEISKAEARTALEELRAKHQSELACLRKCFEEEKKSQVEVTSKEHQKELEDVMKANRLAANALRNELKREQEMALNQLQQLHHNEQVLLEEKLQLEHQNAVTQLESTHKIELQKQKEKSVLALSDITREVESLRATVGNLSDQINDSHALLAKERNKLDRLDKDLKDTRLQFDMKQQELTGYKRETEMLLKMKEETLSAAHCAEMEGLQCQQRHEMKLLLNDFNKAKHLLNKKLQEKEKRLLEMEQRYRNREPRPEDVELIKHLKGLVTQQELKLKELTVEKRIYELELVNREKNYNKLFNASPVVGVMDPLYVKRKSKDTNGSPNASLVSMESLPSLTRSGSKLHVSPSKDGQEELSHDSNTSLSASSPAAPNISRRKLKFLSDTGLSDRVTSPPVATGRGNGIRRSTVSEKKLGHLTDSFSPTSTTAATATVVTAQ